ncbi:hypothetical protein Aduo_000337 [Ancylostoma duodenale]
MCSLPCADLEYGGSMEQWDCATEEIAQIEVAKCGRQALVPPPGYGTIATKMRIRGNCDPTALTKTAIRDAWKKGAAQQASNLYDAANTKFNMMAYQDTDGIGCSYRRCSRNLYIVCFYNIDPAKLVPVPGNLYDSTATICDGCPTINGISTCVRSLCETELRPLLIHKECGANTNADEMTDDLRYTALYMHNYYRRLLASGWAKDGKLGYAKPAAAMIELKYDCDVEDEIMDDLKDCNPAAIASPHNFKRYPKYDVSRENALKEVIKEWWSALAKTGVPDNIYLEADMKGKPLGDYVNMAYDKTTKVGCGVQTCKKTGETYVQCGYTVDTLIDDEDPIYKIAKRRACSGCRKAGMTCSRLGALCVQQ